MSGRLARDSAAVTAALLVIATFYFVPRAFAQSSSASSSSSAPQAKSSSSPNSAEVKKEAEDSEEEPKLPASAYQPPAPAATPDALAAGNFSAKPAGKGRYRISVSGSSFSSRVAIEKYLAYRAALLAEQKKSSWFELVERRKPGDALPPAKADPILHYSFRMEYFLPIWTYKDATGKPHTWSPFKGVSFPEKELQTAVSYEVSADIILHQGMVSGQNPHAFDAYALSDYLLNQVVPPK